jgi:Mrp family chromosome partitioning ATPase
MLDALNQSAANRRPAAEESAPRPPGTPSADVEPSQTEEDVPFIEVGGPRHELVASPSVLAAPGPPSAPTAPPPRPSEPKAVVPAPVEPGSWTVAFRPWGPGTPTAQATALRLAPELIAYHQPEHSVSTQYRTLLNGLLAHLSAPRGQVLLFTSPAPWTGTTTVLLNLAITAARMEGRRVAVIDANLRRPALAERLGLTTVPGLRDVLAGSVPLSRAFQETGQANLWALSAGRADAGDLRLPLDWLLPTLRQLREQFDLVFVDAPSWNEGSEVSALAATCDAVYMVLHQKDAAPNDQAGALPLLRQPPSNLLGCILTLRC